MPESAGSKGRGRARASPRRVAILSRSAAGFYSAFAKTFPGGLAVLHLSDPGDPSNWKLVTCNRAAARIVRSGLADLLALRLIDAKSSGFNASLVYRDVILQQKLKRIGLIRKLGYAAPQGTYSLTAFPLPDNCVGVLFEDVSASLKATRDRVDAESRLLHICDSARAILWTADPASFEFHYVSREAPLVLGYWVERWRHEHDFFRRHVHRDDWPLVQSTFSRIAADATARRLDFRMNHADGREMWFRTDVQLIGGAAGHSELSGVMVDITDQKRSELGARHLSLEVLRGQELERKRISFALHEKIAQHLSGVQWILSAMAREDTEESQRAEQHRECVRLIQQCMDELRNVSYELQPPVLEMFGLIPALRWHAKRFSEESGIQVRFDAPAAGIDRLGDEAEMTLFRVFQECLGNIRRHSRSHSAWARVQCEAESVVLEVEDRGVGVPPDLLERLDGGASGIGLLKIRESVRDLHGQLEVESSGRGTLVRATLPRFRMADFPAKLQLRLGGSAIHGRRKSAIRRAVARSSAKD